MDSMKENGLEIISKVFDINKVDIISIVGAGGKTSLMYSASSFISKNYKVLITTTTKIYLPSEFDKILILENSSKKDIKKFCENDQNGIYVIGKSISEENKLNGLNFNDLDNLIKYFDIVFIESDGSRRKSLKGWNENEPVIYPKSTKTIGVLDIKTVGIKINEKNIHRVEDFKKITNSNQFVSIDNLIEVIYSKNGLFKNYVGDKVLFINKVEEKKDFENTYKILDNLNDYYLQKVTFGSIKNKNFINVNLKIK